MYTYIYSYVYVYIYIHTYIYIYTHTRVYFKAPFNGEANDRRCIVCLNRNTPSDGSSNSINSSSSSSSSNSNSNSNSNIKKVVVLRSCYVRQVRLLRVSISEGLTQADSSFSGVGVLMSVEFYRESVLRRKKRRIESYFV